LLKAVVLGAAVCYLLFVGSNVTKLVTGGIHAIRPFLPDVLT
tara:strand:+ start:10931 stop:11056 length:126 start_codon:yes stop_codon:yes gene_type:complete